MKKLIAGNLILWVSSASMAESMYAVPTAWRLENYIGDGVVAWYTGSTCTNGKLGFGDGASLDDKNRFWSVVMAGKTSGKRVFVYYNEESSNCDIVSFGLDKE